MYVLPKVRYSEWFTHHQLAAILCGWPWDHRILEDFGDCIRQVRNSFPQSNRLTSVVKSYMPVKCWLFFPQIKLEIFNIITDIFKLNLCYLNLKIKNIQIWETMIFYLKQILMHVEIKSTLQIFDNKSIKKVNYLLYTCKGIDVAIIAQWIIHQEVSWAATATVGTCPVVVNLHLVTSYSGRGTCQLVEGHIGGRHILRTGAVYHKSCLILLENKGKKTKLRMTNKKERNHSRNQHNIWKKIKNNNKTKSISN